MNAVITGLGVLSPLGCDWPDFREAVVSGASASPAPFPGSAVDDPPSLYLLSNPDVLGSPEHGRSVEPLRALAVAAVRQALDDAQISPGSPHLDGVGLVMNTVFGPTTALEAYLERLRAEGPRAARPAQFVDTLISMPASAVGIALGLRGSTAVMGGSSPFELALDWIRSGREHTVVAGGGECHSPKTARYFRVLSGRSGGSRPLLAQAAAFLVLEEREHAARRGVAPRGELLGAGAASEPQEVSRPWSTDGEGRAFRAAMAAALEEARVSPDEVGTVVLAAGDDDAEGGELAALESIFSGRAAPALLRPKERIGEALGAAAGLSLLNALADLGDAAADAAPVSLVNAFEMGGAVTTLLVRAPL